MEWVHCNFCYRQPVDRRFFLTNCGHLFCEFCRNKWDNDKCPKCKSTCTLIELTGKDLKPEIKLYFVNPLSYISKVPKEIVDVPLGKVLEYQDFKSKQLSKILEFQREHMLSFFNYYKTFHQKAVSEAKHYKEKLEVTNAEKQKLLNEIQVYKEKYEVANAEVAYCRKLYASPSLRKDMGNMRVPLSVSPSRCAKYPRNYAEEAGSPLVRKRPYENESVPNQPPNSQLSKVTSNLESFQFLTPVELNNKENVYGNQCRNNNNNHNNGPLSTKTTPDYWNFFKAPSSNAQPPHKAPHSNTHQPAPQPTHGRFTPQLYSSQLPSQHPSQHSSQHPSQHSSQCPSQHPPQHPSQHPPQYPRSNYPQFNSSGPSRLSMSTPPVNGKLVPLSGSQRTLNSSGNSLSTKAPSGQQSRPFTPLSASANACGSKDKNQLYERLLQLGCPVKRQS